MIPGEALAELGGAPPAHSRAGERPALRVLMLTTFYPPYSFGGDAIGVNRLAVALAKRGAAVTVAHDVDAYLLAAGKEPPQRAAEPGVEVVGLRSALGAAGCLLTHQLGRPTVHGARLRALAARSDVIWYHNVSLLGGPGLLALGGGLKLYEAHEHWLVCPTHVLWRYGRELCDRRDCVRCTLSYRRPPQWWRFTGALDRAAAGVDAFIAKSEFSREMHARFGFEPPMEVIPYFLPDQPAQDATERTPHPRPYFLFVGRLEKIKGVQDILPAFEGTSGPDLLVIGAGEFEARLRELAAGQPRVRFMGRMAPEALAAYYRHALALVVPSLCYETFGIIVIEAFRMGTPVIARRLGPFPEIVAQGGGMLFDGIPELRAALARIAGDAALREDLGRRARAAFTARFGEPAVLARYLDLLHRVACRKQDARVTAAVEALA